jgi:hypothetical protein
MTAAKKAIFRYLLAGGLVVPGTAPAMALSPDIPDVPSFCSATTAFGQTMGGKAVNGVSRPSPGISTFVNMPTKFAPFTDAEVVLSHYSREVNQVHASAKLADAPTAKRAADAIRGQFRSAGWVEAGARGFPAEAFNPLGDDVADFNSERGGLADPPTGRRVEIDTDGAIVNVSCIDLPGYAKHVKEAFGPPPVGVQRPTPPTSPSANAPTRQRSIAPSRSARQTRP